MARSRHSSRRRAGIGAGVIRFGEIATAVGAIAGLLILLGDHLPWSGDDGGTPVTAPRILDVRLSAARIDEDVTYESFLRTVGKLRTYIDHVRDVGLPPSAMRQQLKVRGVEIGFDLQVYGPPGRRVELTPTVYRAHGRIAAIVPPIAPHHTEHYTSEAWKDRGGATTWAPYPTPPGEYYVDLRVDEIKGGRREFVRSERTQTFRLEGR